MQGTNRSLGQALPPGSAGTDAGIATVRLVLSPVPNALGQFHTRVYTVRAGAPLRAYLPTHQPCFVVINGGIVPSEDWDARCLEPGDELLLKSRPQTGFELIPALIAIGVGIIVSIASAFLMRALFPPQRPKFGEQDNPVYGFEGIRSTVGPGAKVPILYGRHRIGGQFLQASVEAGHTLVIADTTNITFLAQESVSTLHLLLGLGEGEIDSIETASIRLNDQPIANFPGVNITTRTGTPGQIAIPQFSETRNSFADGREITEAGITYTTTTDITAYQLTISFDEGLVRFTSKGEKINNRVQIRFRHKVTGQPIWTAGNTITVEHAKTTVVRVGVRRDPVPLETYDIELTFLSAAGTGENARWRPFLESIMEIQEGTETYPNTALVGIEAVATENLSGAIPNVTVIVRGRRVRVGSFAAAPTFSQNPSWCLMDYLTNARYGLGIVDSEINLLSFLQFAAYCDELIDGVPRHTLDMVIVEDAEAAITQILTSCRGVLYKLQGQWMVLPLRDEPPVQLLSWTNCTNVTLNYTRDPDRINVMEGRFADVDAEWEQSVITWPEEPDWPAQIQKSTIDLQGVTRRAAVMRHLQYELNRRRLPKLILHMDCALDALALTVNDIFRFSHPLPGWGVSGRIQPGSTTSVIRLDESVVCTPGKSYHLYVRHESDSIETRAVVNAGGTVETVALQTPLVSTPTPLTSLYAFGESSPLDTAIREFRVVRMERLTDNTIRITAIQHNPSIYDDPTATPLPVISDLFNPLGPPPALVAFVLLELPRVGPDGRSRVVANLSWDVEPLGPGLAPYGGAIVYRREVSINAMAGVGAFGEVLLAEISSAGDISTHFVRIATVGPTILEYDDPLVVTGNTYEYKVVPISVRGVPNNLGSVSGFLHIAGPTTPEFFPGTVQNLRLKGKGPTDTTFEGRDVQIEWDRLESPLFTETFFLKEYIVEVWAPGQMYLLRRTTIPVEQFTYTYEQNYEDELLAGYTAPRRDLLFHVRGRTNTGRVSLLPATLGVINPPPDMSNLLPVLTPLFAAAIIDWTFFIEPRDMSHYDVKFDTVSPPLQSLSSISLSLRKVFPQGLTPGTVYYCQIVPYDTFGVGVASGIASVIPLSLGVFDVDTTPPGPPTGLVLTTGTSVNPDGTIATWVQASWAAPTDGDLAGHQVNFRFGSSTSPTVLTVDAPQNNARLEGVPGNVTVFAKVAAFDQIRNFSPFTSEQSIVTGRDTTPPGAPSTLTVRGFFRAHVLSWQPPADADLSTIEIWANLVNNRDAAGTFKVADVPGTDTFFQHGPLDATNTPSGLGGISLGGATASNNQTYTLYYWIRARDTSGNVSAFHPLAPTSGVGASTLLLTGDNILQTDAIITTAAQITNALIVDAHIQNLSASKLLAGTINVLLRLGVGNITLDAPQNVIRVASPTGQTTVELGLLDAGSPASVNYGIRVYNPEGVVLFDASQGGVTANGISAGLIQAHHIEANIIDSTHLRADIAVITVAAQIANALISTAHIQQAAITTALIQDAAITTAKIQDAAIISAKIQDAAITNAKIGNLEVNNAKIANLTIGANKIQDNSLTDCLVAEDTSGILNTDTETVIVSEVMTGIVSNDIIVVQAAGVVTGMASAVTFTLRLREDSVTGAVLATFPGYNSTDNAIPLAIHAFWAAGPTPAATKTFAFTLQRTAGTSGFAVYGNLLLDLRHK